MRGLFYHVLLFRMSGCVFNCEFQPHNVFIYCCFVADVQKFPLRMKDNDLLVTELYRDPTEDAITALSVYLTPKTSTYPIMTLTRPLSPVHLSVVLSVFLSGPVCALPEELSGPVCGPDCGLSDDLSVVLSVDCLLSCLWSWLDLSEAMSVVLPE